MTLGNSVGASAVDSLDTDGALDIWQEIATLAGQSERASVERLLALLADQDPALRWQAGVALSTTAARLRKRAQRGIARASADAPDFSFSELLARMQQNLQAADPVLRAAAADALGLWEHEAAVSLLGQALSDPEALVRTSVVAALGKIGDAATVDWLTAALADPSMWVRRAAATALGELGTQHAVSALEQALGDEQLLVRAAVVTALGHMCTPRARRILESCTQDPSPELRWYAARSLCQCGDRASCAALADLRREANFELFGTTIAEVADEAIVTIEKRDRGIVNRVRRGFSTLLRSIRRARRDA